MTKGPFPPRLAFDPSRRRFNKQMAALGLATVSIPFITRPGFAQSPLNVMTYTNYHVEGLIPGFVEKHGEMPTASYMSDDEDAFQKLRAGFNADTAHPNTSSVLRWRDAEMIRPIDTSRLPNWADLFDEVKAVRGVSDGGETFICPTCWGNASIIYRTDLVDPADIEDQSWSILANPKYQGRVASSTILEEIVLPAALQVGVEDIFAMTDEELAEVKSLLQRQHGNLRYYWTSLTDMEQGLASGELVASVGWNTSVNTLRSQGVPVAYMQPKEGVLTWLDGVVHTTAGTADDQLVYDYMNAWISPEAGRYLIEEIGYGHSNRKSFDLVADERLAELGLDDPLGNLESGIFFQEIEGRTREKYSTMVEEVRAGF
jgi:spermidine/putrescine transport system substrate-binding protein